VWLPVGHRDRGRRGAANSLKTPSATALPRRRKCGPPYYDPKGDSPLSLQEEEEGHSRANAVNKEEENTGACGPL
jgi:hypothetical protein